ncbi:PEGA domain-containing protein [Sorangium cellulosum]|uniref:PEGA domain-containing protein n=1 Tax=Sorangium cellulosum TaxID=56 RepID=UPI0013EAC1A7|nr:PEGA domain-containing protein [Sorangium cellulosum]
MGIPHLASPLFGVTMTAAGVSVGGCTLRPADVTSEPTHPSWHLREAPATRVTQRQRAEVLLKEALAKVASITVKTEPEGAEVTVDGAEMGRTPLALPVFLEPGQHMIQVELDGYKPAQERIEPKAGDVVGMKLYLMRRDAEAPAAAGAPGTTGPRAASEPGPPKPPETIVAPPAERSWVPVIALGAASVVGLGVGVGMTVASNNASSEADAQFKTILTARTHCLNPPTAAPERCAELRRSVSRIDTLGNGARVAFAATGALAIAAVTVALWPREKAVATGRVRVSPALGTEGGGVVVRAAW